MNARTCFLVFIAASLGFAVVVPKVGAAGDAEKGQAIYSQSCVACHGADGKGVVPGAPEFSAKDGVLKSADSVLIDRITNGYQSKGSPMAMPPKGGNASLTAQDISDALTYIRKRFGG